MKIEIYKERDSRVEYYFKNKKDKDEHIYDSADSTFEKIEENECKEKQSDFFRNKIINDKNQIQNINN